MAQPATKPKAAETAVKQTAQAVEQHSRKIANAAADPSGYGEGQRFLGSTTVTANAVGNTSFDVTLPAASSLGEFVTATATRVSTGDTSDYSPTAA